MFQDYFADELVSDYRRSKALFWLDDFRQRELPNRVRNYFARHYVHVDGDLHGIGFATPETGDRVYTRVVDVVRAGEYNVLEAEASPAGRRIVGMRSGSSPEFAVDDRPVTGAKLRLEPGRHRVRVGAGSPAYVVTPLPADAFASVVGRGRSHSPLFEYEIESEASAAP
jgi:hypothetical protein